MTRRNELTAQVRSEPQEYRASFNVDNQTEYEAWAAIGSLDSDASWTLCKHTYTDGNLTKTQWALAANFDAVWNSRSTYFS